MFKLRSRLWYNSNQRNGVLILLVLIVLFQVIISLIFSVAPKTSQMNISLQDVQQQIDSLKEDKLAKKEKVVYKFNPNFISDYKAYRLGLSVDEIDRLLSFRAKGNYVNSATEFQEITEVSDSLLSVISPLFKFPDWVTQKTPKKTSTSETIVTNKSFELRDINSATIEDLVLIKGIGEKTAARILKYKDYLHGYTFNEQLYEVYGMDVVVVKKLLKRYAVLSVPDIKKVNVNSASFKEVMSLPYLDYDLTKKVFMYKDEVAEIQSIEELKNIEGFPIESFDKIVVYLTAK